jgi:hypothetical protein
LIVSHFFLDCLDTKEVQSLALRVRESASAEAIWIVSDFAVPETLFGRVIARPVVSTLYKAFGLLTGLAVRGLPNHAAALVRAEFARERRINALRGLLFSEIWTLKW